MFHEYIMHNTAIGVSMVASLNAFLTAPLGSLKRGSCQLKNVSIVVMILQPEAD